MARRPRLIAATRISGPWIGSVGFDQRKLLAERQPSGNAPDIGRGANVEGASNVGCEPGVGAEQSAGLRPNVGFEPGVNSGPWNGKPGFSALWPPDAIEPGLRAL